MERPDRSNQSAFAGHVCLAGRGGSANLSPIATEIASFLNAGRLDSLQSLSDPANHFEEVALNASQQGRQTDVSMTAAELPHGDDSLLQTIINIHTRQALRMEKKTLPGVESSTSATCSTMSTDE